MNGPLLTLIDRTLGWWLFELNGMIWNVVSHSLSGDSAIPPEWDGLVRGKVYCIYDDNGRYILSAPRLKDVAKYVKAEIPATAGLES
tara:strand:- start:441 stop:701 length:261 start_codon:yes stop_codon:yes gene_type:complete